MCSINFTWRKVLSYDCLRNFKRGLWWGNCRIHVCWDLIWAEQFSCQTDGVLFLCSMSWFAASCQRWPTRLKSLFLSEKWQKVLLWLTALELVLAEPCPLAARLRCPGFSAPSMQQMLSERERRLLLCIANKRIELDSWNNYFWYSIPFLKEYDLQLLEGEQQSLQCMSLNNMSPGQNIS